VPVPEYAEPLVGWRIWRLFDEDGDPRLGSLVYPHVWPTRREVVAACRLGERVPASSRQRALPPHDAPLPECVCGIHGGREPEHAALYILGEEEPATEAGLRVLGRVRLWGTVVESERGWRASRAYPDRLYLPRGLGRRRMERLALGLVTAYGVPVDMLDCDGGRASQLAAIAACS
jgi:hypothetical protein